MKNVLIYAVAALAFVFQIAATTPAAYGAETPASPKVAAGKPTGSVAGRVADESGAPITGARTELFSCADWNAAGFAVSDKNGDYLVQHVSDGCYHVRFEGEGYESTWHGAEGMRESAGEVKVAGEPVPGIDGDLSQAGAVISGTVKSTEGKPLAGAWVTVLTQGNAENGEGSVSDGRSDEKGAFSVRIHPGKCAVMFARSGYVTQIYGKSIAEPTMVDAAEGKTVPGIDATLARGGSISGSVTDESGQALSGIYALAYPATRAALPVATRSDAAGKFVLDGLASGKYRIAFGDRERKYQLQWHDGKSNPEDAAQLTVTAPGALSGIKGVLRQSGGISGMVSDEGGNAIPDVIVSAEPSDHNSRGASAVTDQTGSYHITGLSSGSYLISFYSSEGTKLSRYYRDAADRKTAHLVEVAAPQVVLGINQVLPDGILLTGSVSDSTGAPVPEAMFSIYPAANGSEAVTYGSTLQDGTFSVPLPEGEYLVEFRGSNGFLPQWSGNRPTRSEAEPVTVSRKDGAKSVDVVLSRGASIAGTVKNRLGTGIAGVRVSARDAVTGERGESAVSEEGGKYLIVGLDSGSFRLVADGSAAGYMEAKLPQSLALKAPAALENVDILLTQGGAISGRVTDREGNPVQGAGVTAHDPVTWDEVGSGDTGWSGEYKMGGLPEGKYHIRFEKSGSKYPVQWYKGKARREESAQLEIAGTDSVAGIDAVLSAGVPLTGQVTDAGGAPLANAKVEVYGASEDEPFAEVRTDQSGSYTVPALAPGSYRVRFSHADHVPSWYGGRDRRSADRLTLRDTGVQPLSAALTPAKGKFSGKLMNPEGEKIGQAWLTAIEVATGAAVADERICECSGEFHTPVPAGVYQLRVERHGQVVWYGGDSREEATQLPGSGELSGLEMVIEDKQVRGKQAAQANGGTR